MYRILIRNDLNSADEFNANNSVKTNKNSDLYDYNDENGVSILYLVEASLTYAETNEKVPIKASKLMNGCNMSLEDPLISKLYDEIQIKQTQSHIGSDLKIYSKGNGERT